jgi:membrane fusion protein, multidrug efflux system
VAKNPKEHFSGKRHFQKDFTDYLWRFKFKSRISIKNYTIAMNVEKSKQGLNARRIRAYVAMAIVLCGLLFFGYKWYKNYTAYQKTDDAYIDADRVSVSSKLLGRIAALHGMEGDSVSRGTLLVELDTTDLAAQKMQARATVSQAEATILQARAKLDFDRKSVRVLEISLERAEEDFNRASVQMKGNVITKENYDHTRKTYETAKAQLDVANAQLNVSKLMIESAQRTLRVTEAQVNTIQTQLNNTMILAPVSGRIAKRWLLTGDVTAPGQAIFTITRDDSVYVTAFFEETKISDLFIGKEVEIRVDAYPDVIFKGSVNYIASNTAGQFSLIPPSNASGNFTKVTQRIPIRMSILGSDNNGRFPHLKLVSGMSAFIKISR